jgi:5-methylcytosine-specific restriction endonuclease McrA
VADLRAIQERAKRLEQQSADEFWAALMEASTVLRAIAPTQRRPWLNEVILELRRQQGGLCGLCNEPLEGPSEVDHIIPVRYGGGNERGNLQLTHASCNRAKGSRVDRSALLRYLEDRYMNR